MALDVRQGAPDTLSNFNPLDAFEQEKGFPRFIPRDLIENHMFVVECAAAGFKTIQNDKRAHSGHCACLHAPTSRIRELARKNKQQMIRFVVERVIASVQVPKSDPSVPTDMISSQQCQYFKNTMIFFPRSSLGINIKSANKKVYVESTDNGFNSIARRAFYIGDALLAVNDEKCTSVKDASNLLLNSLKTKGIARVIVERPVEPAAIAFVRAVLLVNKAMVMDPKMPDDVVALCNNELKRMRHDHKEPKKHILMQSNRNTEEFESPGKQESGRNITISDTSTEVGIGMELLNPALLEHVPDKIKSTKKSKKKRRQSKESKHNWLTSPRRELIEIWANLDVNCRSALEGLPRVTMEDSLRRDFANFSQQLAG
ncbi:hypothetical protein RB195_006374 [Necator americanus]|uniref:PDZ domain-containing protein n=1 Tax=Necator americanus TaxID=51031 RepID=A0ABR1BU61_NECAM